MINLNTLITKRSSITLIPLLLASGSMVRGYETLLELQDALGTVYYDGEWHTNGDPCAGTKGGQGWSDTQIGTPGCEQHGPLQASLKTNRIVALNETLMEGDLSAWCGKEVKIFQGEEEVVFDEPLVLWDTCLECSTSVRVDFGVGPFMKVNPQGCTEQDNNAPGLTVRVVDNQIWEPAQASTSHTPTPASTLYTGGIYNWSPNGGHCTVNPWGAVISGNAAANRNFPPPIWLSPQGGTPVPCGGDAGAAGVTATATAGVGFNTGIVSASEAPSLAPTGVQSVPYTTSSVPAATVATGPPTSIPGTEQSSVIDGYPVHSASGLPTGVAANASSATAIPPGGTASTGTGSSAGIPTSIPSALSSIGAGAGASLPGINAFASAPSGGSVASSASAGSMAGATAAAAASGQAAQEIPGSEEADCEKGTYSCDGLNLRICGDIQSGTNRIGWIPTGQCPTQCEADCGVIMCN
ncbi:hypothetical protein I302_106338 [Kwoniella bestiolae CBS 10118]|uniref:Uncharacterized protein n=1 Tax=Kwoniella bestiolae CBS 10118 TaxID=1296100 RepID=A0A1B9G3S1_9TREE|nr:hypothetical protein I302_05462 [Kwoniella bestiolae CBS 10118]OCF25638.1 hypothetical protein I302_05462 [Kwoniella bestiolae CBS 10118]